MKNKITIRIPDTLLALLKKQSQKQDKRLSDLVREALESRYAA